MSRRTGEAQEFVAAAGEGEVEEASGDDDESRPQLLNARDVRAGVW